MLLYLIACSTDSPPPPAPAEAASVEAPVPDAAAPAPAADPDKVYVQASSLNLRAEPDGKKIGSLSINSPLTVVERQPGWLKVEVGNGKQGWLGADFVATEPLSLETAVANAKADASQALSWWQRAAAIDPNRDVLTGLKQAYDAAGENAKAAQVQAQLDWPHTLHTLWKADHDGPITVSHAHWSVADWRESLGPVPESQWPRKGLEPDTQWWVLPSQGAAVPAKVTGFERVMLNECGAEVGYQVVLEHEALPEGVDALVASRGAPPESWTRHTDPRQPAAQVEKQVLAKLAETREGRPVEIWLVPDGADTWRGHVYYETDEFTEVGGSIYDEIAVRWTPKRIEIGDASRTAITKPWRAIRDVIGSGVPQIISQDHCATEVMDANKTLLKASPTRCCGC